MRAKFSAVALLQRAQSTVYKDKKVTECNEVVLCLFYKIKTVLEKKDMSKVGILMGSKSDFDVVKPAAAILKKFGVEVEVRVISAHRTPDEAHEYAATARERGLEVIICAAGKAAHLGGVIAALTTLPVIGLPVKTDMMGGLDSLLSIVQMPSGIPVATVGVNGGENAGLLALQILGIKYPEIEKQLCAYKKAMQEKINADDQALQALL